MHKAETESGNHKQHLSRADQARSGPSSMILGPDSGPPPRRQGLTAACRRAAVTFLLAIVSVGASGPSFGAQLHSISAEQFALEALELSGPLRIQGIRRSDGGEIDLLLEPFEVWTPDLTLILVEPDGSERPLERPRDRFFSGQIAGRPGSRAFLSIDPDGVIFGVVDRLTGVETLSAVFEPDGRTAGLALAPVDLRRLADGREFRCGQDRLPPIPEAAIAAADGRMADGSLRLPHTDQALADGPWRARIAIDTDYPFFERFSSAQEATSYVGNLIGYASTLYATQVETELQVSYLRLWNTPDDPWTQFSPECALFEFGKYWNDNMTGESRTVAHFLSGRPMGGGVAWLGVLCSGAFNFSAAGLGCTAPITGSANFGGAYGVSGSIGGSFNPANPTAIWDLFVVAHEIGHNFNSPHTHCFGGLNGNASPIDQCDGSETGQGCFSGIPSLPGPPGQGSGTIMSYCHLQSGGLQNIGLTLGQGHPFGIAPDRVPVRMRGHVQQRAANNPGCLDQVATPSPTAPVADAATAVGETSFTAHWSRPPGSTGFVLDVSLTPTFAGFVPGFQGLIVGAVDSYIVTGLTPGTNYFYRVRATNPGGTSPSSNVRMVATSGTAPQNRIIRLTGDLNFGEVQVGESEQRDLRIFNDGNATLSIEGIVYPSEAFSGSWSGVLVSGASRIVVVTFSPAEAQTYSGDLEVISNATGGVNTRAISGVGLPSILIFQDRLELIELP